MIAIAQELDRRIQTLDPKRAAHCERLVRDVLAILEDETPPKTGRAYKTRTHDFGFRSDIDLNKLGQLADEL